MSLLDVNLEDAVDLKVLPDQTEALLRITRAELLESKSKPGHTNLHLVFESAEDPTVLDIHMWLPIPSPSEKASDPKGYARTQNRFKEFAQTFSFQMPLEVEELVGLEGWALLGEEPNFRTGEPSNVVRYFIGTPA